MEFEKKSTETIENIRINNYLPEIGLSSMQNEILNGLQSKPKWISSKYFYDEKGSKLFEQITQLEEYYPTRTEKTILKKLAPALMTNLRNTDIIELGSGDHTKINILLKEINKINLETINYIPVDVSLSAIENSAHTLNRLYSDLHIEGYVADFMNQLGLLPDERKRLFCFFGSTIGNLEKLDALLMLKNLSNEMNKGDRLLLGMDLIKPEHILHAAYNDSAGVTEKFNKNILNSVNGIIHSNFLEEDFNHVAFFNKEDARIEMHLEARKNVNVYSEVLNMEFSINKGERIHTENSHKYSLKNIDEFSFQTGLNIANVFTDDNGWFALVEFVK